MSCTKSCSLDLEHVFRTNPHIFPALLPEVPLVLVPPQRFPHVKRILALALVLARRVVTVVLHHPPKYPIAHLLVHSNRELVARPHIQVDEPRIGGITRPLER